MRAATLAVPGSLDQRTGGYIYDRRMLEGLRARGWSVATAQLDDSFPHPTSEALADAGRALAAVAPGSIALIDSLALGAMPDLVERTAQRARVVALVHLPLAFEELRGHAAGQGLSAAAEAERRALHAAALVVMTGDTTRQLLAPYALPPERQIVVEPGTDRVAIDSDTSALGLLSGEAARPSDRAPRRTVVGTHPVELLCVATVNALKGHELLLEALASLTSRAWHLTCAGSLTRDAATAARVRGFIAHHGLDDHVTLTGELDEVAVDAAYRRADIFVLATRQDTYGMAVAEAIAHGLPVVATDTGAIAAIIGPDAGIVVPVDDVRSLATALGRIIDEAPLRASLAAGACRARRRLPTWDAAVDRLAAALEPLAHG